MLCRQSKNMDKSYALAFKQVEEEEQLIAAVENRQPLVVRMYMRESRHNMPHHEGVSAVFIGEDGAPPVARDIVVFPRHHQLETISTTSSNLDPMIYPSFSKR